MEYRNKILNELKSLDSKLNSSNSFHIVTGPYPCRILILSLLEVQISEAPVPPGASYKRAHFIR